MIFNSVPGPLQDAQKCKNDTINIVLQIQIKKKKKLARGASWLLSDCYQNDK